MFALDNSRFYLSLVVAVLTLGLVDIEALLVVCHLSFRHVESLTGFLAFEVWRGVSVRPWLFWLDLVSPVTPVTLVMAPVIAAAVVTVTRAAAVTIAPGLRAPVIIIVIIVVIVLSPSDLTEMRSSQSMRKYNAMSLSCCQNRLKTNDDISFV